MKKHINLFDNSQKIEYKTEILFGLTIPLVPDVAFTLIAGISPLKG